jgi:hypothetical protein
MSRWISLDTVVAISDCSPRSSVLSREKPQRMPVQVEWVLPRRTEVREFYRRELFGPPFNDEIAPPAYALAIGLAANESFKTNKMIDCEEMLKL